MIDEGAAFPEFSLTAHDKTTVSSDALAGTAYLLYFYPKDDTPGCTKEACGFRDLWGEIQELGAVVLGISPDGRASLLSDPDKEMMSAYGAWGEKTMYGRKTVGVIRSTVWVGPDGTVKKHWKRVPKAADHPAKVLDALRGG